MTAIAAGTLPASILSVFAQANPFAPIPGGLSGGRYEITINQRGTFFYGTSGYEFIDGLGGFTRTQIRGATIIHELLHAAGILPPDGADPQQSRTNQEEVLKNCYAS